jgi:hypothetical protein
MKRSGWSAITAAIMLASTAAASADPITITYEARSVLVRATSPAGESRGSFDQQKKATAPLHYSIGARGLRASHTWSQDGQENVSVLKPSRIRTVRRAAHIGQAGFLDTATRVIGVSRADWSADDMRRPYALRKNETVVF